MEYRKNEIRAGIFLLVAFGVFAVMVFAVSDIQSLFRKKKDVRVLFSFSDGIEKNAQVRYSGIKIGKVTRVRVSPDHADKVELDLSILNDMPVKADTKAAIKSLGLVGGKYVELSGGSPQAKDLGPDAVIVGEESLKMEELTKTAMDVVNRLKAVAENVERTFGDPALSRNIKGTIQNIHDITDNVKVMTGSKEEVAQGLKNVPDMLRKLDSTTANLKEISDKADKMMGENRKTVDSMLENVKEITNNLKEMTDDLKKNPWKLIRKP